ncbi:hypothetical protein BC939DRAFT_99925 [Gamsiella multidivaricata]|uniref:uncharacterized protein n=1 Tax=Gamsiella multidivaricata TaxID=101098 RepID=UPI00221EA215|nr:uncharacterized protein BC939DRAFT_99925 [Gamsiella multidivaricata]KAI7832279.1 hypothetical protein BC939DRAFT_99925 [Gamsiella multidivaricata]
MTMLPTIDFNNIIKHPLIKATEYSEVHGGTLIKPAHNSSASVHSISSASSTSSAQSSTSRLDEPEYKPVVLKSCRHPADFRDLLHALSKLRDHPQAPNLVVFYGATREHPSATSTSPNYPSNGAKAGTHGSMTMSISSLSLSSNSGLAGATSSMQQLGGARDWIVTKPSAHGTLHEFLKSPQGVALDWMDKIRLIRGVANGLLYLHDHGLLHMNLHSDNVLIENGPTAVLTDFGQTSRSVRGPEPAADSNPPTSPKPGARWVHSGGVFEKGLIYTAPERLANPELNPCTTASDIYSLGVIMLEILTGHRSHASHFLTSSSADGHLRLREAPAAPGKSSAPLPTMSTPQGTLSLPSAMESLIRKICSRDPAQRPGLFVIRSQLKEMANTSFDLHVREPINKGTTGIQLNAKKPISLISVVTIPTVIAESGATPSEPSVSGGFSTRSLIEPLTPKSPSQGRKRTSILRKALDMSLNSPPASPKRKDIQIWEAAVKGDTKAINSLLSKGISVNQRDPVTDYTPLISTVADLDNPNQVPNIAVLELLINRGAEINAFDQKTKQTILHHLCSRPNPSPAVLNFLLDRGANPNAVSSARQTPLHYLAERAKSSPLEPMRLLLDFGADVNAKGPVMWTALHLLSASEKPYLDAMMLLLTRDIDVNARDSNQWTALHFVAHYNQDPAPALKILVDAGADVNALTKRQDGVIQVLLKSKSIDRLAALEVNANGGSGVNGSSNGPPAAASSGLGISGGSMLGQFGGNNRKRSSITTISTSSSFTGPNLARISTVAENGITGPTQPDLANGGNVLLSPEEEAKEESLKKLADMMRWLIVDCGVNLENSLNYDDPYPPASPKNQHVLYRAIRLGMRPIVAVLLETSLVMSEIHVLDDALQVTEEMLNTLNAGILPQQGSDAGTARSSMESSSSSRCQSQPHHRRNSSVSSNGSLLQIGQGHNGNTNVMSSVVTPKSLAVAAASISRIQEIEALLKVWRFGDQRQQLLDSVKARLGRSNRRRSGRRDGSGHGARDDDGSTAGGSSPVSSASFERDGEREGLDRTMTA